MTDACIFCRIARGDAPAYLVDTDDATVAFLDTGQATRGHTLVVPRNHSADIWDIAEPDALAVMATARRVARRLADRSSQTGSP